MSSCWRPCMGRRCPGARSKKRCESSATELAEPTRLLPACLTRRQLEHPALAAAALATVLEDPKLAVRGLLDGAHAHAHLVTLGFTRAVAVELDADDRLRRKAADQRIALPLRELVTAVEQQIRRRDHGVPPHGRRRELGP